MTDPMYALYQYTCLHRMPAYLLEEEYQQVVELTENQYQKFCANPDLRESFQRYHDNAAEVRDRELEAMFQAAFALALELGRA